jgi:Integrase core domain/Chromo (CHRromatin Organisation MOdifier) domain
MDFICGLPRSCGRDVILVVVDKFTKFYHLITLTHPFKASEVSQLFLDNVYKLQSLPHKIITDRDPLFTSNFWTELMKQLGVTLHFSTAYHPQTDGQTERLNHCIENYLRCMVFQKPRDWCKWISLAEWWYYTNYHTALKLTPFEALYGYALPQLSIGAVPKSVNQSVNDIMEERIRTARVLKEQLLKAQQRMKKFADKKRSERKFSIGDWVYLKLQPYRQVSLQGKATAHKLKPKFYGPYEILRKIGEVAYELNLPKGSMVHPVFHVSQLKRCIGESYEPEIKLPIVSSRGRVRIEPLAILDKRMQGRKNSKKLEVLVKWSSLDEDEATWEDYIKLCEQFPTFKLEDKLALKGGECQEKAWDCSARRADSR